MNSCIMSVRLCYSYTFASNLFWPVPTLVTYFNLEMIANKSKNVLPCIYPFFFVPEFQGNFTLGITYDADLPDDSQGG